VLITNTTNGASTGHSLYLNAGVPTLTQFGNAAFASTATINANAWNHIAVVCNSNSGTFYVNGSTAGTFTWGSGSAGGPLFVGAGYTGSNTLNGYISGVRYVVGSIVVPSGVPTTPPTAIPNTSLLLNFTNGAAVDATGKNNLESVGKAQNSTVQGKWGVGSMVFSRASADYLNSNAASTDLYAFGSGDFVIEFWVRLSAYPSGISIFYDSRPASTQGAYPALYVDSAGTLYYYVSSADRITSPSSTLGLSQWHYVAIARASGNTRLYVDGAQKGSTYSDSNVYLNGSQRPVIGTSGNNPAAGNCVDGFIDDLRITKGSARGYTGSTISIPTGPFPIG
jgi:hypothetical protein